MPEDHSKDAIQDYDAIVIGAGQAGGPLAGALADAGWRVAVVERKHVGGTCVNEGCTPTKTMVASARVAHLARRAGDYGVRTGPVSVDLAKVRQRKRAIVEQFREGSLKGLMNHDGLELIRGGATFTGERTLRIALNGGGERQLRAEHIFINAGARPRLPELPGLAEIDYLTSSTVMDLGETPEHLIVLGGGYIGLEFAQMFHRFGSRVTVVQRSSKLLNREDDDVADEVAAILREEGLELHLAAQARAVEKTEGGLRLTLEREGREETLDGSHLLVAVGRVPNSGGLGLGVAGIETDEGGHIRVNERLETSAPGVYALGDIKGGPAFTHISYDDYRIVRDNLLKDANRSTEGRLVPYTVFIDPQLGRVGLSETAAKEKGYRVGVAKLPMASVARALETDETQGFMKAVVDVDSERILGAAILGIDGGEVMAVLQTAMMGELPYTALRDTPFAHPTLAESLNNLFATLE